MSAAPRTITVVCPACREKKDARCAGCGGQGWMEMEVYEPPVREMALERVLRELAQRAEPFRSIWTPRLGQALDDAKSLLGEK